MEYKASIEAAVGDVDATAALCEQYGIIPKAAVAKQAIPNWNLKSISTEPEMKESITGYFQVLFDANPKSIGGAMPDDGSTMKERRNSWWKLPAAIYSGSPSGRPPVSMRCRTSGSCAFGAI